MKRCIREEIIYLMKSKMIVAFILVSVLLSGVFLYSSYVDATCVIEDYYSFSDDISNGTSVIYTDEAGMTEEINSDEELQYYKELAEMKLYSVSPQYTVEFVLESICSMSFFLFAIFAVILALYDYKNNTIRLKMVRHKRADVLIAKQVAMILGMVVVTVVSTVLVYLGNMLYYQHFLKSIRNAEGLSTEMYKSTSPLIYKVVVALIIIVIAGELGFAIATIIKKSIVAYFVIIVYSFFVPTLGKYDPRSCISALMYKYYDYYGSISLEEPALESIKMAIIILIGMFVLCYGISYLIYVNRSAYK